MTGQPEDAGYQGVHKRPDARQDVTWHVAMRPGKRKALDKQNNAIAVQMARKGTKNGARTRAKRCDCVI